MINNLKNYVYYKLFKICMAYELKTSKELFQQLGQDEQITESDNFIFSFDCHDSSLTLSTKSNSQKPTSWTIKDKYSLRDSEAIIHGKYHKKQQLKQKQSDDRLASLKTLAQQIECAEAQSDKNAKKDTSDIVAKIVNVLYRELSQTKLLTKYYDEKQRLFVFTTDKLQIHFVEIGNIIKVYQVDNSGKSNKLLQCECRYDLTNTYLSDLFFGLLREARYEAEKRTMPNTKFKQAMLGLTQRCADKISR